MLQRADRNIILDLQAVLVDIGAIKANDNRLIEAQADSEDQQMSGIRSKKMFNSSAATIHDEDDSD